MDGALYPPKFTDWWYNCVPPTFLIPSVKFIKFVERLWWGKNTDRPLGKYIGKIGK